MAVEVLGLSGSLRAGSYNTALLRAAQALAPSGMTIITHDLNRLPFFDQDVFDGGDPPPVAEFLRRVRSADALLLASPEYNYSVTAVLKNAIDWASRPRAGAISVLDGKPVAIFGAAVGQFGTVRAQFHLRQILLAPNCMILRKPEVYVNQAKSKFDADGRLIDTSTREMVGQLLVALLELIESAR